MKKLFFSIVLSAFVVAPFALATETAPATGAATTTEHKTEKTEVTGTTTAPTDSTATTATTETKTTTKRGKKATTAPKPAGE